MITTTQVLSIKGEDLKIMESNMSIGNLQPAHTCITFECVFNSMTLHGKYRVSCLFAVLLPHTVYTKYTS